MNTSLDGAQPLAQQTLDLRNAEAAGHILLSIYPDLEKEPWNTAVLKPLALADPAPRTITLTSGNLPAGSKVVWMGVIYADGKLTPSVAYRS